MTKKLLRASGIRGIPGEVLLIPRGPWSHHFYATGSGESAKSLFWYGKLEKVSRYECIEGTIWVTENGDLYRLYGTGGGRHVHVASYYLEEKDLWTCKTFLSGGGMTYDGEILFEPITTVELLFSP